MDINQLELQLNPVKDDPVALLRKTHDIFGEKLAVLSSFGAESVLLLAMVAEAKKNIRILFLNTGKHFEETLAYKEKLIEVLGLTNIVDVTPEKQDIDHYDPTGELWAFDADACCRIRKVEPLQRASLSYKALVTGRKRSQASTRATMQIIEQRKDGTFRINPLAFWTAEDIQKEITRRHLPPHPLVSHGYLSIGCEPCTRPVQEGEEARCGRWSGLSKTECGIHL